MTCLSAGMPHATFTPQTFRRSERKVFFRVMNAKEAVEAATAETPFARRVMPIIKSVCTEKGRLFYSEDDLERFRDHEERHD